MYIKKSTPFLFTLVFCSILPFCLSARQSCLPNDSVNYKFQLPVNDSLLFRSDSPFTKSGAAKDIESGEIRILFSGGFGGMPDFENERDLAFQKQYGIVFYSQGCLRVGPNGDEAGYNQVIFKYLDEKYGERWRDEIRKDAIGLDNYPDAEKD